MTKDFEGAFQPDRVRSTLAQATGKTGQQDTASPEEIAARKSALRTQGRKGAKATRINMAFRPENYTFIKIYSKSTGKTLTEACNEMLDYARTDPKFIEAALNRLEALKNTIADFENGD